MSPATELLRIGLIVPCDLTLDAEYFRFLHLARPCTLREPASTRAIWTVSSS